ncbi:hypothetical protein H7J07_14845 [Mycobacterium koreense]|nr:hypothetical protein [Mycolicibacillus koreensis]BBY53401.1 low molecular weight antigen MTB12 [Mycolicibacillus koreensis]
MKSLATGVAAVVALGAAAAGVTPAPAPTAPQIQPVVFGAPLPLDPVADVPTAGDLVGILSSLANPGTPFASKSYLVEGGIGPVEGHVADKRLQKAADAGSLPLSFDVANVTPAGPGTASADVTVSGPNMAPQTMTITFVNQGGWKLSRTSAMTIMQAAGAR